MQDLQNKLLEKLKNYNNEAGEMNSVYNGIKKDLRDESDGIINDLKVNIGILINKNLYENIYVLLFFVI